MKGQHRTAKRPTLPARIGVWISLASVLAGLALVANIALFYYRSDHQGEALIRKEKAAISKVRSMTGPPSTKSAKCIPEDRGSVAGLLLIPSIGLTAPVVQGSGDLQLADAVGHNPASSWPGGAGTTVFDGHDVTWFHHLTALHPGDTISYTDPCHSISYKVTSRKVVAAGTPIYEHRGQLDLVTCYPLDALYLTNQRLVVEAAEVGEAGNRMPVLSVPSTPDVPVADVPPQWEAVATLQANPVRLGTLQVTGQPDSLWTESAAPLQATANVQETYFATIREAEQVTADVWAVLHPSVPFAKVALLHGRSVASNRTSLETSIAVSGSSVVGATIVTKPTLDDGSLVSIRASFGVKANKFVLEGFAAS